jgi:hypothetical protein
MKCRTNHTMNPVNPVSGLVRPPFQSAGVLTRSTQEIGDASPNSQGSNRFAREVAEDSRVPTLLHAVVKILMVWLGFAIGSTSAWAQCVSPYWQQLNPAQSPPGPYRGYHAMAYDSKRAVTVLYGGAHLDSFRTYGYGHNGEDVLGDTWEFDGLTWRQILPSTQPFTLVEHAMSYDPVTAVMVMFGGVVGIANYPANGFTWEYDGTDWHAINVSGDHPEARWDHRMVYDSARGVHVMYGGFVYGREPGDPFDIARPVSETWEYDAKAHTWTLRSTNGPPRRVSTAMVYDSARNQTVLFGGFLYDADSFTDHADDTWVWNGAQGTWTQLLPAHKPAGRGDHEMAFDLLRGVAVLLGGEIITQRYSNSVVTAYTRETWEWNGSDWEDRSLVYNFCCNAQPSAMVYESARQQVMLFDLFVGAISNPDSTYALATGNGRSLNYVDWSNFFFLEDGSPLFPFRTLGHALPCTLGAATISIRGGDYPEGALQINKQVRIVANNGSVHIH